MSHRYLVYATSILIAGIVAFEWLEAGEAPATNTVSPQKIQQLMERLEKLEARVEQLESRLPTTIMSENLRWVPAPTPQPMLQETPHPQEWQRREFNGFHYYLVPLDTTSDGKPEAKLKR